MKKLVSNRIVLVPISIVMLIWFNSCKPKESSSIETNQIEIKIAEKVAEYVIEKDSLKFFTYSNEVFLHISLDKLNDNTFKTLVSLNGLTSKSSDYNIEELNINGFKTLVYRNKTNEKYKLAEVFFVPDAKSWSFLSEYYDDEIWLNQLTRVYSNQNVESGNLDELEL